MRKIIKQVKKDGSINYSFEVSYGGFNVSGIEYESEAMAKRRAKIELGRLMNRVNSIRRTQRVV